MSALSNLVMNLLGNHAAAQQKPQAHPAVAHLTPHQAVQAHQLLMTHPAVQQHLQVQAQHSPANLGVPYTYGHGGFLNIGQGGQFNPGLTPLQNSGFGPHGNPQQNAFQPYQQTQQPQFNPQDNPNQQYWLP